ncbi:hypothetical protein B0H13DRAFT_1890732 [Mycena leptocephala]|nr:hypothetical protein B0H13DRAFT_1890732 [Mycena leptocephala]
MNQISEVDSDSHSTFVYKRTRRCLEMRRKDEEIWRKKEKRNPTEVWAEFADGRGKRDEMGYVKYEDWIRLLPLVAAIVLTSHFFRLALDRSSTGPLPASWPQAPRRLRGQPLPRPHKRPKALSPTPPTQIQIHKDTTPTQINTSARPRTLKWGWRGGRGLGQPLGERRTSFLFFPLFIPRTTSPPPTSSILLRMVEADTSSARALAGFIRTTRERCQRVVQWLRSSELEGGASFLSDNSERVLGAVRGVQASQLSSAQRLTGSVRWSAVLAAASVFSRTQDRRVGGQMRDAFVLSPQYARATSSHAARTPSARLLRASIHPAASRQHRNREAFGFGFGLLEVQGAGPRKRERAVEEVALTPRVFLSHAAPAGKKRDPTEDGRYTPASLFRLRLRNVPRTSVPETWTYRVWFIGKGKSRSRDVDGKWDANAGPDAVHMADRGWRQKFCGLLQQYEQQRYVCCVPLLEVADSRDEMCWINLGEMYRSSQAESSVATSIMNVRSVRSVCAGSFEKSWSGKKAKEEELELPH